MKPTSLSSSGSAKLCIFITSDAFGGAERYIDLLVQALDNRSFDVVIIGRLLRPSLPGISVRSIKVGLKWSRRTLFRSLLALLNERGAYLRAASSEKLSIAHLQFKREQILLSRSLSRHIPVVWTEHGLLPSGAYGILIRFLYRRSSRHVKMILCVSQAVHDELRGLGISEEKLKLSENPVNVDRFMPDASGRATTRQDLSLGKDEVAVLVMSRLDRYKGIHRVIRAMSYLPQNYVLLIAGAGPAEEDLRRQSIPFGERITFLGFREDPVNMLRASDIFCFASTAASGEGVPTMAVLEAMATGLPVVATHDSGLAVWLPPRGGLVADSGDEALANSLVEAYARQESLGCAARASARQHDIEPWKSRQRDYFVGALG